MNESTAHTDLTHEHKVLVTGGTHGNEMSGIAIVQHHQDLVTVPENDPLSIEYAMVNQAAVDVCRRFIDTDINRLFEQTAPGTTTPSDGCSATSHELQLAEQWKHDFAGGTYRDIDVLIDIHNTTSAMGATLILTSDDPWHRTFGRLVKNHMPRANLLFERDGDPYPHGYLCRLAKKGMMIEVGAQANNLTRADALRAAVNLLDACLQALRQLAERPFSLEEPTSTDAFMLTGVVAFPASNYIIHEHLQDADFQLLQPGDPIFRTYAGEVITWNGQPCYPHFINEAAYWNTNLAFATADKIEW